MAIPIYKGVFDSSKSYPELSIVQDSNTQNAILYISTKSVPVGSSIFDPTYWVKYNKGCGLTEGEVEEMITSYCGDLEDLSTEDKSSLVNAINELDDEHEALSETVSDIVDGTTPIPHQVDWEQDDETAVDYINNKPTIPSTSEDISYDNESSGMSAINVQEAIDELEMTKLGSIPVATTEILGGIKPDGTTITVDENGVASASGGGGSSLAWTELEGSGTHKSTYLADGITIPNDFNELMLGVRYDNDYNTRHLSTAISTIVLTKADVDKIYSTENGAYITCGEILEQQSGNQSSISAIFQLSKSSGNKKVVINRALLRKESSTGGVYETLDITSSALILARVR